MGIGTLEDLIDDPLFNHTGLSLFEYKTDDNRTIVVQKHKHNIGMDGYLWEW